MQAVGDHLANFAKAASDAATWDLFGRSAFNRYYYGAFLAVRTLLRTLNEKWDTPSHAEIPDLLRGPVFDAIKKKTKEQVRAGLLDRSAESQIRTKVRTATIELAELLENARSVRTIADYEPETKIERTGTVLSLLGTKLDTAKAWQRRIEIHIHSIVGTYGHLGLLGD